ncbi:MAG TPA: biopolymer transporter ExbD [Polyangiaceae bacterium]|nr:biopolymer transporter ExbD [Polyangiaceae bacterium]
MAGMEEPQGGSSEIMSQINVTPLVDVLLVLLLVLMVSASAAVARALDVHLPSAASGQTEASTLTLRIDAEGGCWLDDERVGAARLRERLSALGAPERLSVVIAADGATAHRHVIAIMDLLRAQHIVDVAFAVRAPDTAP